NPPAKVSKVMRADWGKMAEEYLSEREQLRLFIQLIDSRHKPMELDLNLHEWLKFHNKNSIVVATKSDKLSTNQLNKSLNEIEKELPDTKIIPYSAKTGKGREAVWREIEAALNR
nr:YihA family ribosome biogenesis GTP-binding protein [Pyrinomonadaceae bacterium]